jgi:hypothetical protein
MMRALRRWLLARELDRALARRRIVSRARSEAAQRGVSTYWSRAAAQCRQTFGGNNA